MKKGILLVALLTLWACQEQAVDESQSIDVSLKGDMLFEGANSLTAPVEVDLAELAGAMELEPSDIQGVELAGVQMSMEKYKAAISESMLFQIVSDKQDMKALASLSPLPEAKDFQLNPAEETDIMPYLRGGGATWVLDLNLSEDHMDMMEVNGVLKLRIKYSAE